MQQAETKPVKEPHMKIEGSYTIEAARELLFALMTDAEVLSRCVPGVESLETVADGSYKMLLKAGVGSIKGTYTGAIRLEDLREPEHYKMIVDGKGAPGFLKGTGVLDLIEEGEATIINYSGEVSVGGTIASVGQRMIQSSAKMMTAQFFAALEAEAKAIIKAEDTGEPVVTPKQGMFRNFYRATSKALRDKIS
jgi:carbon monoxide dehydrogenase subunit G